jgi:hypothetical protein
MLTIPQAVTGFCKQTKLVFAADASPCRSANKMTGVILQS